MTSLRPEDVPGAVLPDQVPLETHPVVKLEKWLECRGLKNLGTKAELITRIENCVKAEDEGKIFSGVDGGKWYDITNNAKQGPGTVTEDSTFDNIVWGKFPSHDIPQYFNEDHIYTFIVGLNVENEEPDIAEVTEDQSTTTVKPFRRGHQYVNSEHISDVEDEDLAVLCQDYLE